jgi:hypothetical protein
MPIVYIPRYHIVINGSFSHDNFNLSNCNSYYYLFFVIIVTLSTDFVHFQAAANVKQLLTAIVLGWLIFDLYS